jgi:hypothetical protein
MRRYASMVALLLVPVLAACPKKKEEVIDAGPPPAPTPVVTQEIQNLQPIVEEDAGIVDAGPDVKKPTGPGVPANVARLRQCCAQLGFEAKKLGASPEAGMLAAAAAQCNVIAAQAGPNGNAPELGAIRNALKGRTVPPVCAGF